MAEMKLSEELRHCLEEDTCGDCGYRGNETVTVCGGLLQKAYERIGAYEEAEGQKSGEMTVQEAIDILNGYKIDFRRLGALKMVTAVSVAVGCLEEKQKKEVI